MMTAAVQRARVTAEALRAAKRGRWRIEYSDEKPKKRKASGAVRRFAEAPIINSESSANSAIRTEALRSHRASQTGSANKSAHGYREYIGCIRSDMRQQSGAPITAIPKVEENDSTSPTSSTAHGRNSIMSATAEASEVGICRSPARSCAARYQKHKCRAEETDEEKPVSAANSSANAP